MQRLNAIDAISPAFARTHLLLFKPFSWRTSWKVAASAYVAQAGSFFFPFPLAYVGMLFYVPAFPHKALAPMLLLGVVSTLFYCGIFYCCARLGLVEFEIVVTLAKRIAPMWRRYQTKVWPWIGAKVFVGLLGGALAAPLLIHQGKAFFALAALMPSGKHSQSADPAVAASFISAIFGFYLALFLAFLIPKTFATLLDDFVMPFYLLEDLSVIKSIQRAFSLFAAEPFRFVGYLLLKLLLFLVAYLAFSVALQICMIPFFILLIPGVMLVSLLVHAAGVVGTLLGVALGIVFGVLFIAAIFYVSCGAYGYLMIAFDCYAAYFLGGRYPLLGSMLEPGPGGPFTPPPVFPSADERNSSDNSGPSLPLNPAVA